VNVFFLFPPSPPLLFTTLHYTMLCRITFGVNVHPLPWIWYTANAQNNALYCPPRASLAERSLPNI
jgi:hypothetical protein